MGKVTEEQVQKILMNPFYVITFAEELVAEHQPLMSEEEWIQSNVYLIQEIGPARWLADLLEILEKGNLPSVDGRMNPYNAINIDPMFALEHPPAWEKGQWLIGNARCFAEVGATQWLETFLDILKGNYVKSDEIVPPAQRSAAIIRRPGKKRKKRRQ